MKKASKSSAKIYAKSTTSEPQTLASFIQAMQSIPTDTEEAKLNETIMSDNNGKRITYTIIKGKKYKKQ